MKTRTTGALTALLTLGITLAPIGPSGGDAAACGGFFCNAVNPVPILQSGERVVFARHEDRTTMHVEVQFEGQPTSFGWVMPLPHLPLGQDGQPLPLDKSLQLSHESVFDVLANDTAPSFSVDNEFVGGCQSFASPSSAGGGGFDAVQSADVGSRGPTPPVKVLQEAAVGPYKAQIIQATNADALYDWLNENGYLQDEKARPVLTDYVNKEYVFLGLRLQNGKAAGDLRPVALTLGELAPCVPLRLTGIAASPDMPILVFVLGEHRAIPKNHLHARINPQALSWPGASNYAMVVGEAIDQADGHAFVTDYAGPTSSFASRFASASQKEHASLKAAETLDDILAAYDGLGFSRDATFSALLMDAVPMPEGLRGYPYHNCFYDPYYEDQEMPPWAGCEDDASHVTTEAEFYSYLDWWLAQDGVVVELDDDELRQRLIAEVAEPLSRIQALFDETKVVTRMYTSLDPEEMTRDPIFSFNPDLPMIDRTNVLKTVTMNEGPEGCGDGSVTATYPNGKVHVFDCNGWCSMATLGPVPGVAPLAVAEVLEESGQARPVHPNDVKYVSQMLALAEQEGPSLPEGFVFDAPDPDISPRVTGAVHKRAGATRSSGGCSSASGATGTGAAGLALAMFALVFLVRTRRRA